MYMCTVYMIVYMNTCTYCVHEYMYMCTVHMIVYMNTCTYCVHEYMYMCTVHMITIPPPFVIPNGKLD